MKLSFKNGDFIKILLLMVLVYALGKDGVVSVLGLP